MKILMCVNGLRRLRYGDLAEVEAAVGADWVAKGWATEVVESDPEGKNVTKKEAETVSKAPKAPETAAGDAAIEVG